MSVQQIEVILLVSLVISNTENGDRNLEFECELLKIIPKKYFAL